jgi:hypothetical protein
MSTRLTEYGPPHRWFAWRPVDTHDHGWKWLRQVWRQRRWVNIDAAGHGPVRYWSYTVLTPKGATS